MWHCCISSSSTSTSVPLLLPTNQRKYLPYSNYTSFFRPTLRQILYMEVKEHIIFFQTSYCSSDLSFLRYDLMLNWVNFAVERERGQHGALKFPLCTSPGRDGPQRSTERSLALHFCKRPFPWFEPVTLGHMATTSKVTLRPPFKKRKKKRKKAARWKG